ncbi:MAG: hypothetical protein M1818_007656 [Claussenomyces sp. TS43310]|nr:MAG: hypothetical protein M1818_007656 [Claussenomyces sp. TS43310]
MDNDSIADYNSKVDVFRAREYPMLKDSIYLDHAGTTLYPKSLMERFSIDMISNLYGNPHSGSASSQLSTARIEDTRLRVLQFFKADPCHFDLVFVANATAGVKLVMDAFRSCEGGFMYGYHKDSHTSLVGVRENAAVSQCLEDQDVQDWLSGTCPFIRGYADGQIGLFSYPGQSNMNGRRLPLSWSKQARDRFNDGSKRMYCLLDAAALVSTSQLDLSDAEKASDFTVLSFNKIFGFPDLGALIVRKDTGSLLRSRSYFGGGTVEMVSCIKEQWHAQKEQSLHECLEDGTLPIHSIMALNSAMNVHTELFESMDRISKHTMFLAKKLYNNLNSLRHASGGSVCKIYADEKLFERHDNSTSPTTGPTVAFNLRNGLGEWISNAEVEKLAALRRIHIRTGGLCNPGGIATALNLSPWEMMDSFSSGYRCGNENDIMKSGKPVGVIRASLGAMSTISDVESFVEFIKEFYVEKEVSGSAPILDARFQMPNKLFVESITIFPIKSCGGYKIQKGVDWEVRREGLAWDREWCLIHQGTGQALSQKRYPKMALIKPYINFQTGILNISYGGAIPKGCRNEISVRLSPDTAFSGVATEFQPLSSRVCGESITAHTYTDKAINDFFTNVLDVPCALARFPAGGSGPSARHSKAHMQRHQRPKKHVEQTECRAGATHALPTPPDSDCENSTRPILLSNESPILMLNKSSLDLLNDNIRVTGGKTAAASVFRANIVVASSKPSAHQPYGEDHWSGLQIGSQEFKMLGACRRCHMICVDQETALKDEEPFVTLAKTRKFDGKVFFGSHMCHVSSLPSLTKEKRCPTIRVGDPVEALLKDE